ncbi:hypothetical protein T4D_6172 [Trichinella pseudospiralis]|uniref:Uncharacterized protein n=1 Tax=Trichinella pseudospiralis TaxID=6337 RepID=A0A0V1FYG0_TRIPS|nr:hypothetical protein T4D_6172 [Trichinella pseudospiralis]
METALIKIDRNTASFPFTAAFLVVFPAFTAAFLVVFPAFTAAFFADFKNFFDFGFFFGSGSSTASTSSTILPLIEIKQPQKLKQSKKVETFWLISKVKLGVNAPSETDDCGYFLRNIHKKYLTVYNPGCIYSRPCNLEKEK